MYLGKRKLYCTLGSKNETLQCTMGAAYARVQAILMQMSGRAATVCKDDFIDTAGRNLMQYNRDSESLPLLLVRPNSHSKSILQIADK